MITITLTIPKQELPTKELRALLAAALCRGAGETNSWLAEDAVMAVAHAMQDAKITETM
jgi:homoserine kinase